MCCICMFSNIHPVSSTLPGSLSPALLILATLLSYGFRNDRALSSFKKHFRNDF